MLAYAAANLAAFAVVIIVSNATGTELIKDYAGLSKRNPLVALSLTIALLSLAGLPLMAGFMAKFYVFLSAAQVGLVWLVAIGVVNSVISVYYYLRVVVRDLRPRGAERADARRPARGDRSVDGDRRRDGARHLPGGRDRRGDPGRRASCSEDRRDMGCS